MRKSLIVLTTLVVLAFATVSFAEEAASSTSASGVVNINTAEVAQLQLLPRVGPKAAQAIVEYRKAHGAFKKTSDLMQVKGIGAKTFERMAPYLAVDGKTTLTTKIKSPRKPRAKKPASTASN